MVLCDLKEEKKCKNKLLLSYFGEIKKENCGVCSYCIALRKSTKFDSTVIDKILNLLKTDVNLSSLAIQKTIKCSKADLIFALQNLLETNTIEINKNNTYSIKQQ